jgi:hypothetical protein
MLTITLRYAVCVLIGVLLSAALYYGTVTKPVLPTTTTTTTADMTTTDKSTKVITKAKDGTKVVKITNDIVTKRKEDTKSVMAGGYVPMPRFSLGGGTVVASDLPLRAHDYYITSGVRIIGNIWFEGRYEFRDREISVGTRVDY